MMLETANKFSVTASVVFGNFVQVFLTLVVEVPLAVAACYFCRNYMTLVRALLRSCVFVIFCLLELFQVSSSTRTSVNIF